MKTLQKYDFKTAENRSDYPWDKILDGGIYQLEKGEGKDFECEVTTFTTLARVRAQKRNKNVKISVDAENGVVVLQATPMTADEIKANESKMAARKEKDAVKRAEKKAEKAGVAPATTQADAPAPKPVQATKGTNKPAAKA